LFGGEYLDTYAVELQDVDFSYRSRQGVVDVLRQFRLHVKPGEFVALIGPSGCGKSTIFKLVAGLAEPTRGLVRVGGESVRGARGQVAFMPQRDLLLPWRTVLDNAILFLEIQGIARREARERAREMLRVCGLSGFEAAYPAQLSGGMRQRVAFMRTALSGKPVLLLDEPFGALDALTRLEMQQWLLAVWGQLGTTILFITHDVDEAILLADRVVLLGPRGTFTQAEWPVDLARPRSRRSLQASRFLELKVALLDRLLGEQEGAS
jgi:ABC-type nitrate/sulfonate/bicarbonate transport system ATPase subunit